MSGKQEKLKIKKRKRDQQEKVQKNASNGLAEPETVEEMQEQMQERVNKIRKTYINKQRTLVLSSRGITSRFRHLMEDVCNVMPHSKKDVKLDTKDQLWVINEICDMKSCNNCIFFECRKKQDLFMWVVRAPHGPSMKFRVLNVHTMDELKFTGNSLKGSRPILSFDAGFDSAPQYKLMKELLTQAFGTPKGHPKSKPFIDHVFSFNLADGKIWFRNFQVAEEVLEGKQPERVLTEIGPRFVLEPVKIVSGSFGGPVIYENPEYISPNVIRSMEKAKKQTKFLRRVHAERESKQRRAGLQLSDDELDTVFQ